MVAQTQCSTQGLHGHTLPAFPHRGPCFLWASRFAGPSSEGSLPPHSLLLPKSLPGQDSGQRLCPQRGFPSFVLPKAQGDHSLHDWKILNTRFESCSLPDTQCPPQTGHWEICLIRRFMRTFKGPKSSVRSNQLSLPTTFWSACPFPHSKPCGCYLIHNYPLDN